MMTELEAICELNKLADLGPDDYFHRTESKEVVAEAMKWLKVIVNARSRASIFAIVLQQGSQYMAFDSAQEAQDFAESKGLKGCHLMYIQKMKGVITHD